MKCLRLPAIAVLVIILVISLVSPATAQSAGLQNVSAVINTLQINTPAELSITFKLPFAASEIRRTNYIQIRLNNFRDITPPTAITGPYTGTPQYSVENGIIKITGITVVPGAQLTITGITATTPGIEPHWPVEIFVTQDSTLNSIRNAAYVDATLTAGTVTVSAIIDRPEATLTITGYTSPNAYVTFTEHQSVAGTDVAGLDGHFGKTFTGLAPGSHQITFFSTDALNRTTSPVTIDIYTPTHVETIVSNQLLSPTVSINKNIFMAGENIIASGSAIPNGNITLFTQAPLRIYTTTADANGNWSYTITNTNEYVLGDYYIYALAQSPGGLTSLNSPSQGFTITSTTIIGTACGDISNGDLNCDGNVDLTDFSILMYYWGTANAVADINGDHMVNLTDFSILMYWWGT